MSNKNLAMALVAIALISFPVESQTTASIAGVVRTSGGNPIQGATVSLVETRQNVRSGTDGSFLFTGLAPGHYHLLVQSRRFADQVADLEVGPGEQIRVEVEMHAAVHSEEIVVTASPDAKTQSETYQAVSSMDSERILVQAEASLGETLNSEPGVTSTYFGPGSSRPIIRGLGGDRIRILEGGIGTGDASNVSPDHAVTTDPLSAERIEIVRGPATLLYGSNAVGGVVNVLDNRIPESLPGVSLTGKLDLILGSVADERVGAIALDGELGNLGWHLDYLDRSTDDYEIPGPAEHEDHEKRAFRLRPLQEDHEEEEGILENSSIDTNSGTAGVSWITPRGFLGVSVNRFETNYGVPGHGHHEEEGLSAQQEEEEEEHVRIDMNQTRFDLKGERTFDGLLRRVRVRFGTTDYEHVELEGAEIGTEFTNEAWEGRIEAAHGPLGALEGTVGAQISRRDFAAFGEEAFVPPTETGTEALFVFEELERGDWSYQFGARYEHQDVTVHAADLPDRSFSGLSGSIGAVWFAEGAPGIIAASIARAVRLPTAEELYSNGPHAATRTFEVGDVNLDEETSLGVDLSFRRNVGPVQGELTLFWSDFSGFIFPHPTGEVEDGLPVFFYRQSDATFTGLEALMHITVWEREPHHLEIEIGGDLVDADLDGGGNLSRIAPARLFAGLIYQGERWFADVTARHVFDQDDVADFEEPTDGYTLLEANAGFRFLMGETAHQVILRGRNLTDELARSHVSPLKEVAPLPGRDLSLAYRLIF